MNFSQEKNVFITQLLGFFNSNRNMTTADMCKMRYIAAKLWKLFDSTPHCPMEFDGFLCWPQTDENSFAYLQCPAVIEGVRMAHNESISRFCHTNGTWASHADYRKCYPTFDVDFQHDNGIPTVHLQIMYYMYWVGYSISLLFLLFALAIFLRYKSLWCLRNIIHSNLILCFALHNVVWIMYSLFAHELVSFDPANIVLCAVPTVLLKYFIASGFFWMFVEGFYLLINVVFSFHARKIRFWMCALFGWGVPLLLVSATSVVKETNSNNNCWEEQKHHFDYIFIGPVLALLFINFIFMIFIMYVVMSKLRITERAELRRYSKGLRALLILCPLLGINYVLVLGQPSKPLWLHLVFGYYTTLISSSQGSLVAMFFCFKNSEVVEFFGRRNYPSRISTHSASFIATYSSQQQMARLNRAPNALNGGRQDYKNVLMMDDDGKLRSADQQSSIFRSPNTSMKTKFEGPRNMKEEEVKLQ